MAYAPPMPLETTGLPRHLAVAPAMILAGRATRLGAGAWARDAGPGVLGVQLEIERLGACPPSSGIRRESRG